MIRFILIAICCASTLARAQFNVQGTVVNSETNEPLVGATVQIEALNKGVVTNSSGEFEIQNVQGGQHQLRVDYLGFITKLIEVNVNDNTRVSVMMKVETRMTDEVIVYATRASDKSPTTFSNIKKEDIQKQNFGQDLPFLLNWTPSVVVTSDAGAGVGYTGIRIRGTDPTRINVTINGIPINDSESQGVFWVNMPDISTSTNNVQVQRGVGTSTNGAGAFGGSINILTNTLQQEPEAEISTSFGSFNTQKYNAVYRTGLLKGNFAFEGRLSKITSDGYIDRASSNLGSYFLSAGYYGKKSILKLVTFAGHEKTYQSWWGTPEARLNNDLVGMNEVIINNGYSPEQADNLLNSGRTFNYYQYDNQVDDYGQDHYQAHFSQEISDQWSFNTSLHYTKGAGFFEEYKEDEDLADYALNDVQIGGTLISSTDLIRRRWLDNDFYGFTYGVNYENKNYQVNIGGAYNEYRGDHFGEVIWAEYASNGDIRHRYYESQSEKNDFNTFGKVNYQLTDRLNLFGDLQIRHVTYTGEGNDNDLRTINFGNAYTFFNPKFGLTFNLNSQANIYGSFARGNKEPNRSDIIDAIDGAEPKPEQLDNIELGYRRQTSNFSFSANYYLMNYKNQLVLTGEVNDVGSGIRTNASKSYRTGIEIQAGAPLARGLNMNANIALSQNKIQNFEEVLYDYGANFDEYNEVRNTFTDTDISFSPNIVAGGQLSYTPIKSVTLALLSKYVGDQYLDNTSNEQRKIDAFFVNDFRVSFSIKPRFMKEITLSFLVNNIFDTEYESNGYTFGYFAGQNYEVRENYYYPQAGRNFMTMAVLRF